MKYAAVLPLVIAGCVCPQLSRGTAAYEEGLAVKPLDERSARAHFERALEDLIDAVRTCKLTDEEKIRLHSMLIRCCFELDRFETGREWVEEGMKILDRLHGQGQFTGDAIGLASIRAAYHIHWARRALENAGRARAQQLANIQRDLAIRHYSNTYADWSMMEERLDDPQIRRYHGLRLAELLYEWAQVYALYPTPDPKERARQAVAKLRQAVDYCAKNIGQGFLWEEDFRRIRQKAEDRIAELERQ